MNTCTQCNHDLVNILYGKPSDKLVEMAKNEDIALGGRLADDNSPKLYCYGCGETY